MAERTLREQAAHEKKTILDRMPHTHRELVVLHGLFNFQFHYPATLHDRPVVRIRVWYGPQRAVCYVDYEFSLLDVQVGQVSSVPDAWAQVTKS